MDADLINELAAVGVDESLILRLDEKTNIDDWESMFGPGSSMTGNKVPGWEDDMDDIIY